MKQTLRALVAIAALALFVCEANAQHGGAAPLDAHGANPAAAGAAADATGLAGGITGKVVETMDASTYTYVQVDDGTKKIWAAAPKFPVKVGDQVTVPPGQPMQNFPSKTLNRTFDVIYFVGAITVHGAKDEAKEADPADRMAAAHGATGKVAPAAPVDFSNLKKAEGGKTVAEIYADKAKLTDKEVAVRGKVVKFNSQVMGKNWLHVQDGTGAAGTNDLTVTTSATAAVGDTVLVRGKLAADRDFGFGYKYELLVEDATIVVE